MMNLIQAINRSRIFLYTTVAILLFSLSTACNQAKQKADDPLLAIKVLSVKTANGWGYKIMVDNKVFIQQLNIPASSGNKSFQDEHDAMKIGQLVARKLSSGQPPTVTMEELGEMRIKM